MAELKPCPFCGGVAKLRHFKREKCYRVACEDIDCDCVAESGYHATEAQAIEAWNRRTVDVVEVVRCKDCKHFVITKRTKSMFCDVWCTFQHMGEENYCSHGERKDND